MKSHTTEVESLRCEIEQKSSQIVKLEETIEYQEKYVLQINDEIEKVKLSLAASEEARMIAEKALEESTVENQQLTKDVDTNLEQIKEFMEEVRAHSMDALKITGE